MSETRGKLHKKEASYTRKRLSDTSAELDKRFSDTRAERFSYTRG